MRFHTVKATLALMMMCILVIPVGIMGGAQERAPAPIKVEGMVSGTEGLSVERVASAEVNEILTKVEIEPRDMIGLGIHEEAICSRGFQTGLLMDQMELAYGPNPFNEIRTRSSDDEKDQYYMDMYNGSLIASTPETISGTLDMQSPLANSDLIDWYKIQVTNVDPRAGTSSNIANFTITLNTYKASTSSDDDLYELKFQDDGDGGLELESNYADLLDMTIIHYDYWNGMSLKGGYEFFFDDGDDTDEWYHDGNWTFNWRADLKSEGTRDTNGLGNGLTELNWYYLGIRWNYVVKGGAPNRDPFEIDYQFTISSPTMQSDNVYSNDWKNATHLSSSVSSTLSSLKDQDDWFEIKGSNYSRIWDIDFWWNRTVPVDMETNPWSLTFTSALKEVWMRFYLIYSTWGVDRTWGTSDDGWDASYITYSLYFTSSGV